MHSRRREDIPVDYAKHRHIDYVPMSRGQEAVVLFCLAIIAVTVIMWSVTILVDLLWR